MGRQRQGDLQPQDRSTYPRRVRHASPILLQFRYCDKPVLATPERSSELPMNSHSHLKLGVHSVGELRGEGTADAPSVGPLNLEPNEVAEIRQRIEVVASRLIANCIALRIGRNVQRSPLITG